MTQKYRFQIYLLFLVLLSYWPFTFFQNSLLFDNIDVALASKYFAGSCLQNGFLPLWNPYQIFGFPAHADLQYTNWNIEVMLIGLTRGYDYITLHILYLIYIYLGGLGMFYLARFLSNKAIIGFYIGIIYVLSSLFTTHSQSLVTILGLVWLPYVILFFLKWLKKANLQNSILLALFSYIFFTLGYQAFAFMIIPLFVSLFFLKIIELIKSNETRLLKKYFIWGFATIVFLIILLSPVIVSQLQSKLFVARLNGLSVQEVMANPFHPFGLISFFNPLLILEKENLFNTDISMRSVFIGLLPLMLLIISLFKKNKNAFEYILLFFSILFLLASFGEYTPVRKLLFYIFPGWNLFRFPALIRIIAIICLLMYLAKNYQYSIKTFFIKEKIRGFLFLLLLFASIIITFYAFAHIDTFNFIKLKGENLNTRILKCSYSEITFYYGLFQILFLLTCLGLLKNKTSFKIFYKRFLILTIIELSFTIVVFGQFVAFGGTQPHTYQACFKKLSSNFPNPSKDPISENTTKLEHIKPFWKNTGNFKKQLIPNDEWTSFLFSNYQQLSDNYSRLKDTLFNYPFIYFSKPNNVEIKIASTIDTIANSIPNTFHYQNSNQEYNYIQYNPHKILIECNATEKAILNLQQTYYTGWKVMIDSSHAPLLWNASLLMSVSVPKGKHIIEFKYENPKFVYALIASYSFFIILIFALIINSKIDKKHKYILGSMLVLLPIYLIASKKFITKNNTSKNKFTFVGNKQKELNLNLNNKIDYRNIWDSCMLFAPNTIIYSWENFYNAPEFLYSINYIDTTNTLSTIKGKISINTQTKKTIGVLFYEKYDLNYPAKQFIDSTHLDFSLKLSSKTNPYSSGKKINTTHILNKNIYGFVVLKSKKNSSAFVACHITYENGKEEQLYFPLNKYLISDYTFQKIPFYFETKGKIKKKDEVKLFLMNQTEEPVYIKEVSYTAY